MSLLETPLHDIHQQRGGRMVDFAGWSMPVQYQSIITEHQATRNAVGLFDVSHMGRIQFPGQDAAEFLDRMLTREVASLRTGGIRYSLVANEAGEVLDDVLAYSVPASSEQDAHMMLVVNASNRETILQHMGSIQPSTEWQDVTTESAMLAVQGPQALACCQPLVDIDLESLRYYRCTPANVCGVPSLVSRTGYTGEDGCELIVPAAAAAEVWQRLEQQTPAAEPVGLGARDTLRLEAGMPLYGHELTRQIDPFQAGLDFAVNLDRPFIGAEALRTAKENTPIIRVGLELQDKRIARENASVLVADEVVGRVTSGSFSPTFQKPIAMAMIQKEHAAIGTEVTVDIRGRQVPAAVTKLPFYKRTS